MGVTGATTLGSTLNVTGAGTFSSTLVAGASTLASASITGAASVGGTLGVTGATTLSSTLTAGTSTLTSLSVTNNETVGGTLGVTGATSLSTLMASGTSTLTTLTTTGAATLASANITGNASVGGTLGVTNATTLSGISSHGGAATFSSTVNVTGATTLTTLTASGTSTLTALTTTGVATFSSTVKIPTDAGLNKILTSDANGVATWNGNPFSSIAIISTATASTPYPADLTKQYIIYNYGTSEAGKISIPAAATANQGAELIIKNKSGNTITITPLSSGTIYIDNANTSVLSVSIGIEASNNWIKLVSDGSQWIVFRALF